MTRKEFEYWKDHRSAFFRAYLVCVYFNKCLDIKCVKIDSDSHYNTITPTIREVTCCTDSFNTIRYEIHYADFKDDSLVLTIQRKHDYRDAYDNNALKLCLVGPVITLCFKRKYIRRIDVRMMHDFN